MVALRGKWFIECVDCFVAAYRAAVNSGPRSRLAGFIYLVKVPAVCAGILVNVVGVFVNHHCFHLAFCGKQECSLQPFRHATVMGTRPFAALAETVTSVAALRCRALRCAGTVFRTLYGFTFAVYVGSIVRAFRL